MDDVKYELVNEFWSSTNRKGEIKIMPQDICVYILISGVMDAQDVTI